MTDQAPPPTGEQQGNTAAEAAEASGAPAPEAEQTPAPTPAPQPAPTPPPAAEAQAIRRREEPPPPLGMDSDNVIDLWRLAGFLCESELLPGKLSRRMSPDRARNNVFLMMLIGKDRGLTPMQSISGGFHVIEGKIEIGAHAMVALCLSSPACEYLAPISKECTDAKAVYRTRRRGWPECHYEDFTFTVEEAGRMGLLTKGRDAEAKANNNWQKMPGTMCRRRAATGICREYYPDVVLGLYDHGEITETFGEAPDLVVMPAGTDVSGSKPAGVPITDAPYKTRDPLADRVKAKTEASREADAKPGRRPAPPPPRRDDNVGTCEACGTIEQELDLAGRCQSCR